nr:MAG TPA: hypothetical protein [Caudoviricetes sp.]
MQNPVVSSLSPYSGRLALAKVSFNGIYFVENFGQIARV